VKDEFMVGWTYHDGYSAYFEQDDATGWFYVSKNRTVILALHIYNRSTQMLEVREKDVEVIRSNDGNKVGVVIWKELRGIIDISESKSFKDNRGIRDEKWLKGFDYDLRPDTQGQSRAFVRCH
jgi:hypothetical protein